MKAITTPDRGILIGVPRFWTLKDGSHDNSFNTRSDAIHFAEGWKTVIEPAVNPETQRLGAIFERTNDFTYPVIQKSQAEIDQYQEDQLNSDTSAQKRQKEVADGLQMFERFLVFIQRRFDQGWLTGAQAISCFNLLYMPLLPLKDGMFRIAQSNLNAIANPANAKVLEVLNLAKTQVNNYITNNP
jgi:hypothetical protein